MAASSVPEYGRIGIVIGMTQHIAEIGHFPPWDLDDAILQRRREMQRGFADDFEVPFDRGSDELVRSESLVVFPMQYGFDGRDGVQDVTEPVRCPTLLLHQKTGRRSGWNSRRCRSLIPS